MKLVKLLKGCNKTCNKHSYIKTVGKTSHIHLVFSNSTSGEGMGKDI